MKARLRRAKHEKDKKLSCRRETERPFVPLNILLRHKT